MNNDEAKNADDVIIIPLKSLERKCNPFREKPWEGDYEFSRDIVTQCISTGDIENIPWDSGDQCAQKDVNGTVYDERYHARRVAYLVVHPSDEPILLDVGMPGFGFEPKHLIQDGCHRLAAAIYRGDQEIKVAISGDVKRIKKIFPKAKICPYENNIVLFTEIQIIKYHLL